MWLDNFYGSIPYAANLSYRKLAKYEDDREFINTFEDMFTQAIEIFKYEGLPETCDARMIERSFILKGMCLFAKVNGAYLVLAAAPGSGFNVYGYPTKAFGYGYNGFNKEFNLYIPGSDISKDVIKSINGPEDASPDAVLGYDNSNRYPFINYILAASNRLTNLQRSMDVTVQNLKQPVIIQCDDRQVNTIKQALNQRDENVAAIVSNGKVPMDEFKVWNTNANPAILTELRDQYEWSQSRAYKSLGIDCLQAPDKRERLISGEAEANQESVRFSVDKRLKWREKWCDEINKCFGLNVSVSLSVDDIKDEIAEQNLEKMYGIGGMNGGADNVSGRTGEE